VIQEEMNESKSKENHNALYDLPCWRGARFQFQFSLSAVNFQITRCIFDVKKAPSLQIKAQINKT